MWKYLAWQEGYSSPSLRSVVRQIVEAEELSSYHELDS